MENRAYALASGLFLLLLGLALAAAVAWFQGDSTERAHYTVVARSGVPGLNLKAPVKLRGVEVGKVEAIAFDPTDARRILVGIAVDTAAPVTTATYAQLGLQGVTGLSFIALEDAASGQTARAAEGAHIELKPTLLDRLAVSGPELINGFSETAQRLNTLLGDANQAQLKQTLAQVGAAAEQATQLLATTQASARALPALLQAADNTLQRANGSLQQIDALAAEGRTLAQDLRSRAVALDRLGAAAQQLTLTVDNLDRGLVGGDKPRTRPVLDDIAAAGRALERTATDLGEQPSSLLFGRSAGPPGPGESGFEARLKGAP
jgi:phospholipid/cholesterol/gamma-HCH transport system substrate-binding protein